MKWPDPDPDPIARCLTTLTIGIRNTSIKLDMIVCHCQDCIDFEKIKADAISCEMTIHGNEDDFRDPFSMWHR